MAQGQSYRVAVWEAKKNICGISYFFGISSPLVSPAIASFATASRAILVRLISIIPHLAHFCPNNGVPFRTSLFRFLPLPLYFLCSIFSDLVPCSTSFQPERCCPPRSESILSCGIPFNPSLSRVVPFSPILSRVVPFIPSNSITSRYRALLCRALSRLSSKFGYIDLHAAFSFYVIIHIFLL